MKRRVYLVLLAVIGLAIATGCEKEYDLRGVDRELSEALTSKYPDAVWVEWEKNRSWFVAEFRIGGRDVQVWYSGNAQWCMTETDLGRNVSGLPAAVSKAFEAGEYASWRVDDIDKYERPGEVFYLLEIEKQGERDRMLFYSENGGLLKDVRDRSDVLPDIKF